MDRLSKTSQFMRIVRTFRGVTLDQLSQRTGLPAPVLSRIENGYRALSDEELATIKAALDWPSDAALEAAVKLLSGEAEPADLCERERTE